MTHADQELQIRQTCTTWREGTAPRCSAQIYTLRAVSALLDAATPSHAVLRLAGLVVVLAGLFGMHGLNSHGVAGSESMSSAAVGVSMALPAAVISSLADVSQPASAIAKATEWVGESVSMPAHGEMVMSMGAMCVAILAGAILVLRRIRRLSPTPTTSTLSRSVPRHLPRLWDPDPPSLTKLAINRC